jgi:hypothetical protein
MNLYKECVPRDKQPEYYKWVDSTHFDRVAHRLKRLAHSRCEICGSNQYMVSVHHYTYARLGFELPDDFGILCLRNVPGRISCHTFMHEIFDHTCYGAKGSNPYFVDPRGLKRWVIDQCSRNLLEKCSRQDIIEIASCYIEETRYEWDVPSNDSPIVLFNGRSYTGYTWP